MLTSEESLSIGSELTAIDDELRAIAVRRRELTKRRTELENVLAQHCETKGIPGIKCSEEITIMAVTKGRRPRKKDLDKKHDTMEVLQSYGVTNAEAMYPRIVEAMRGEKVNRTGIQIQRAGRKKK